jgi:hypothetical protein
MWPSTRGAKNWPHVAYNPTNGLVYATTNHMYSNYRSFLSVSLNLALGIKVLRALILH